MLDTAAVNGRRGVIVEMTDGTSASNVTFRRNVGFYYALVKANVERIGIGLSAELEATARGRWRRPGLVVLRAYVRELRGDRSHLARGVGLNTRLCHLGVAHLRRARHRGLAADHDAWRWAGGIASARQLADAYGVTDTDGSKPDCRGYLAKYGWSRDGGVDVEKYR